MSESKILAFYPLDTILQQSYSSTIILDSPVKMANFTIIPAPSSYCRRNLHFSCSGASSSSSFFSDLRLPPPRLYQQRLSCKSVRRFTVLCASVKAKTPSLASDSLLKEPHKYFDQVIITVRSGDGGHGAVLKIPNEKASSKSESKLSKAKSWKKGSYKRDSDGSLVLPLGGHGGDVVIYADESKDTLLEFHQKSRYNAKRGGSVGSMGVLSPQLRDGSAAPTLRIPVPVGTVVKRKRGKLLADLANPGEEVLVARGGQGGISLLEMPEHKRGKMMGLTTSVMRDDSDKVLALGQPGEEVSLELILRVVADVGLVGLPNAGKSTLLSAITLAKPEIADYPFTTLMPNLGRLDGDPTLGAGMYSSEATLADLPGLIEGAHLGKGLGRNFLRHLRRTRFLVHVVDAAAEDPVRDYRTVKEELRMYNPDYLERPYIVALNKIDLPQARDRLQYLTEAIREIGIDNVPAPQGSGTRSEDPGQILSISVEHGDMHPTASEDNITDEQIRDKRDKVIEEYPRPLSVIGVSVLKGIQVTEMLGEIRNGLRKCRDIS
ncbi:putative GTP-binding protein OBGC2 [Silene latifolia]|uniref:putative GTP-binding protein OBGC2 n=1 Tax=Silene latifolia TaxID=37657 RepID=UPI003D785DE0